MAKNTEDSLMGIVSDLLQIDTVDPERSFNDHGGDSWTTIQLTADILRTFSIGLTSGDVMGCGSIREMAGLIQGALERQAASPPGTPIEGGAGIHSRAAHGQGETEACGNEVPLTANRFSYFLKRSRNLEHWNVCSRVLQVVGPFDDRAFNAAVRHVWSRHEGLRLQLHGRNGRWRQTIAAPEDADPLEVIELPPGASPSEARSAIEASISQAHGSFSFPGPLFKVLAFKQPGSPAFVYLLAHHALLDAHAFTLARNAIFDAYAHYKAGRIPPDTGEGTSIGFYAASSIRHWLSREEEQLQYWNAMPWDQLAPLRTDFAKEADANQEQYTVYEVCKVGLASEPWLRTLMGEGSRQTALVLLLCAISRACLRWTGASPVQLAMVFHGRDSYLPGVDLSRTIGWISETIPMFIDGRLEDEAFFFQMSRQLIQARMTGKSYGILKYLSARPETVSAFEKHPDPEISLNFISPSQRKLLKDDAFIPRPEFVTDFVDKPSTERVFLVSGGVYVQEDALHISWDFSRKLFSNASIRKFGEDCLSIFLELGRRWSGGLPCEAVDSDVVRKPSKARGSSC